VGNSPSFQVAVDRGHFSIELHAWRRAERCTFATFIYEKAGERLLRHFTGSDENEVIGKALVWCDGENALAILELVKTIRRAEYRRASKRIEPQPNKNQSIAPNPQISQLPINLLGFCLSLNNDLIGNDGERISSPIAFVFCHRAGSGRTRYRSFFVVRPVSYRLISHQTIH
jgi:hypothetical protein